MISFGGLPIKRSLFGELSLGGLGISEAPTYSLPQYIIPGNLNVLIVGPLGSWDLKVRSITYVDFKYKSYTGIDADCELIIFPSNGSFSAKFIDKSTLGTRLPKQLTDIPITYDRGTGKLHLRFGYVPRDFGDLIITGNTISGSILMGTRELDPSKSYPLPYSYELAMQPYGGALYEVTGNKRPIELFVPLTTKTVIPSIVTGLTVVETGTQLLMEQGASKQAAIASLINPFPYIPPGSLMVIPINSPYGLWKISYIVGGVENRGQLEIADFGGQLVGRLNVSGGMLYGSSGWESISNVQSGGFLTKNLSFVRDYTRQVWEGIIKNDIVEGTYGGGFSKGGGTWGGVKEPVEIFIPTDITEYTKAVLIEKEMPLATLVPTQTVSGEATGTVLVEKGFAPTKEEALVLKEQITSISQVVPITIAATKELLPTAQDSSLQLTLSEGGIQEILKNSFSGWGLLVLGGVGVLMLLGRGKEDKERRKRR